MRYVEVESVELPLSSDATQGLSVLLGYCLPEIERFPRKKFEGTSLLVSKETGRLRSNGQNAPPLLDGLVTHLEVSKRDKRLTMVSVEVHPDLSLSELREFACRVAHGMGRINQDGKWDDSGGVVLTSDEVSLFGVKDRQVVARSLEKAVFVRHGSGFRLQERVPFKIHGHERLIRHGESIISGTFVRHTVSDIDSMLYGGGYFLNDS